MHLLASSEALTVRSLMITYLKYKYIINATQDHIILYHAICRHFLLSWEQQIKGWAASISDILNWVKSSKEDKHFIGSY